MNIKGNVSYNKGGLVDSIRAMHLAANIYEIAGENLQGFDKIGYQRKEAVVSSFAEYLGSQALSKATDDTVGRIANTDNPLDFALREKGYFQVQATDGSIKLTRDGRFQIGKNGELQNLLGEDVISDNGLKITLPFFPEKLSDIKVNSAGDIAVLDRSQNKMVPVATFGIVSKTGERAAEINVVQQHLEASNVDLPTEIMKILPYRRNFEANLQMYNLQSSNLSRVIQQLGS